MSCGMVGITVKWVIVSVLETKSCMNEDKVFGIKEILGAELYCYYYKISTLFFYFGISIFAT
jgi:hypothetical protein